LTLKLTGKLAATLPATDELTVSVVALFATAAVELGRKVRVLAP
jgi:hypothetical protein